jgi:hypothetical protein
MTAPTKTPIDPSEIRKGDLIRCEWDGSVPGLQAAEFTASGHGHSLYSEAPQHYLLDRPIPPVSLPTEPTLGWLTARERKGGACPVAHLAIWNLHRDPDVSIQWNGSNCGIARNWVTAFIPAVAVPTDALAGLRKYRNDLDWDCATPAVRRIDAFLAAVDEATP